MRVFIPGAEANHFPPGVLRIRWLPSDIRILLCFMLPSSIEELCIRARGLSCNQRATRPAQEGRGFHTVRARRFRCRHGAETYQIARRGGEHKAGWFYHRLIVGSCRVGRFLEGDVQRGQHRIDIAHIRNKAVAE